MLPYITNVTVVFPSFPGSISVFFPMFSKCLTGLHLFVYSFKLVIQVHHVASIHLRGCHECKKWMIGLCPTCRVLRCLCSIKCKFEGWIPCLFEIWTHGGNCLRLCGNAFSKHHPAGTSPIHPNAAELKDKSHTIWHKTVDSWGNINLIVSISWMTPPQACFHDFQIRNSLCWQLFVT